MNTYYKIAIFYLVLAALFTIFGFYMTKDMRKMDEWYAKGFGEQTETGSDQEACTDETA